MLLHSPVLFWLPLRHEPDWSVRKLRFLLPGLTGCLPIYPFRQSALMAGRLTYADILIHLHRKHFSSTDRSQMEKSYSGQAIRHRTVFCPFSYLRNSEEG